MKKLKTCIVIPARLKSTRLPEKLLLSETGRPLIQHTYQAAQKSQRADRVLVATDAPEILHVVEGFGGTACLTDRHHTSGTERLAEIAQQMPECELFVNLQGDEPELEPQAIDQAIESLIERPEAQMASLACPIRDELLFQDPDCVKVVFDNAGRALYFSRSPIPFWRDADGPKGTQPIWGWQHVGVYVYRREFLLRYSQLPGRDLEMAEKLEQLRVLQSGYSIQITKIPASPPGIDTAEDYASFVRRQSS